MYFRGVSNRTNTHENGSFKHLTLYVHFLLKEVDNFYFCFTDFEIEKLILY